MLIPRSVAALLLGAFACLSEQAVIVNPANAKWTHEANDPPGAESVLLREDPRSGGVELFVRYPGGHVFAPHWHNANERIMLIEGRLSLRQGSEVKYLEPGGFAFLPAKEVQVMSCVSETRCTFYLSWDAKPDFHPASQK